MRRLWRRNRYLLQRANREKMVKRLMKKATKRSRYQSKTLKSLLKRLHHRRSKTRRRAQIPLSRIYLARWYHTSMHNMQSTYLSRLGSPIQMPKPPRKMWRLWSVLQKRVRNWPAHWRHKRLSLVSLFTRISPYKKRSRSLLVLRINFPRLQQTLKCRRSSPTISPNLIKNSRTS